MIGCEALQCIHFTDISLTILPPAYCKTYSLNRGGARGFHMPGIRRCHFRRCPPHESAGTQKDEMFKREECSKVATKKTKVVPLDSPTKEDSENIYFVGVL